MGSRTKTYFFKNKPLFGLDIGSGSLKVMQLEDGGSPAHQPNIFGYGTIQFDHTAVDNGVIVTAGDRRSVASRAV